MLAYLVARNTITSGASQPDIQNTGAVICKKSQTADKPYRVANHYRSASNEKWSAVHVLPAALKGDLDGKNDR